MAALKLISLIIVSYFIGNFNSALVISKIRGKDIRKSGSGNPGTMNMLRTNGIPLGALTLALDILKGVVPCILGWWLIGELGFNDDRLGIYVGGICAIIGHIFPVLLKFKGGKGIATTIGVCFVIQPIVTSISFAIGVAFLFITQMGSLTSFLVISFPLAFDGLQFTGEGYDIACAIMLFGILALTLFAHRKNLVKLFKGTENPVVLIKKRKKKDDAPPGNIADNTAKTA